MPTHGSLTKAGRVRSVTPKIGKTTKKNKTFPRKRNGNNYRKRILSHRVSRSRQKGR